MSDPLRAAVLDSRESLCRLAARSGLDRAALSRFATGKRGLSLDSADRLATALGLRLVATRRRGKGGGRVGGSR